MKTALDVANVVAELDETELLVPVIDEESGKMYCEVAICIYEFTLPVDAISPLTTIVPVEFDMDFVFGELNTTEVLFA